MRLCSISLLFILGVHLAFGQKHRPLSVDNGKFFEKENRRYLYGGDDSSWHFDINSLVLNDSQFHYGIGREYFPALIDPKFITVKEAKKIWKDDDRFLLLKSGNDIRAYSIKDLTRHEVVNDIVGGKPIMAAYCILADLGAIYDRVIADSVFTFALSGYTYFDPSVWDGMDGFVMWDRETESLWWPLIGKAVSGPMLGTNMKVLDESKWSQTTWSEIRKNYPRAMVLMSNQDFDRPTKWKRYQMKASEAVEGSFIAPKWGENARIN